MNIQNIISLYTKIRDTKNKLNNLSMNCSDDIVYNFLVIKHRQMNDLVNVFFNIDLNIDRSIIDEIEDKFNNIMENK